jgi:hypothetical protein
MIYELNYNNTFHKSHFQQYFSYIVVVSFICGGNQSNRRKPPTYRKSMTNITAFFLYSNGADKCRTSIRGAVPLLCFFPSVVLHSLWCSSSGYGKHPTKKNDLFININIRPNKLRYHKQK